MSFHGLDFDLSNTGKTRNSILEDVLVDDLAEILSRNKILDSQTSDLNKLVLKQ